MMLLVGVVLKLSAVWDTRSEHMARRAAAVARLARSWRKERRQQHSHNTAQQPSSSTFVTQSMINMAAHTTAEQSAHVCAVGGRRGCLVVGCHSKCRHRRRR